MTRHYRVRPPKPYTPERNPFWRTVDRAERGLIALVCIFIASVILRWALN